MGRKQFNNSRYQKYDDEPLPERGPGEFILNIYVFKLGNSVWCELRVYRHRVQTYGCIRM